MKLLDLSLEDAVENIALDEALLETAESDPTYDEILRLWEPTEPIVVLGRSSPLSSEVNLEHCRQEGIPVVRRSSGGATIVTGPGCLMYAVVLDYRIHPELRMLEQAHAFVMTRMRDAVASLGVEVGINGTSDLVVPDQEYGWRKFSGNSMRAKRNWMLYHGTLLCKMDMETIFDCLGTPKRQPDYREQREHRDFLTQIDLEPVKLKQAILNQWNVSESLEEWPQALTEELVSRKYRSNEWTQKL